MSKKALLIDTTLCIGCNACVLACKERNHLPEDADRELSARTLTVLHETRGTYVRQLCMHCETPSCVSACPVGALRKTAMGPVVYEKDRCIGCRYCMIACPFQVPRYEWDTLSPKVMKCDMCADRVASGKPPACAEACPTGATLFGDRDELIREARRRLRGSPKESVDISDGVAYALREARRKLRVSPPPKKYVPHIYGVEEAGGTSVMFLSSIPFEQLGFRAGLGNDPLPALTWETLSKIPDTIMLGGAFLFGIWWIINRRIRLQELRPIEEDVTLDRERDEGGSA